MPRKGGGPEAYRDATGGQSVIDIKPNTPLDQPKGPTAHGTSAQNQLRIESRRTHIAELIAEGVVNQVQITKLLGSRWGIKISRGIVQKDIRHIREEWRKLRVQDADVYLGRELAKIDRVEAEAWKAWHDSRKRHVTDKEKSTDHTKIGQGKEIEKIRKDSTGDPRYLDIVQSCIDKRCKLLGLQIPEGSNSINVMIQNHKTTVVNMSNVDLRQRLDKVLGVN